MRGKVSRPRQKAAPRPASDSPRAARSVALSFSDLEIPVRPLLNREQERHGGERIQGSLSRLAALLPLHPRGYRRFLARMSEVVGGGGLMFSWLSLRASMAKDLEKANRALERSERLAANEPAKAWRAFDVGVRVLRTYPLDPETLYQWARDVTRGSTVSAGALGRHERSERIERLIGRLVGRLEHERDELVLPNFRLVLKEVFRYHPTGMRRSDLFQEGVLGLQKAVFRFDPTRATRFSTYATYWIRQAIRKALIDKSRMIRVPQAVQENLRKENSTLSADDADRIRRLMNETMLFSAAETDDGSGRSSFTIEDATTPELGELLHTATIPQVVSDALGGLANREREVVLRRFGLAGERPQTLEEIGLRLNLSRERIRQIEREALTRMRHIPRLQEVYEDLGTVASGNAPSAN